MTASCNIMAEYILFILVLICATGTVTSTLTCPGLTTVNNSDVARWQVPTATSYAGDEIYLYATHSIGDYFPLGNTTVTYTVQDVMSGTEANCSFVVEVISDGSPEIFSCPDDQVVSEISPSAGFSPVSWSTPAAIDPNGGVVNVTSNYVSGDSFSVGTVEVSYLFSNEAGKTSECNFKVEVTDLTDRDPPVITSACPNDILEQVAPGVAEVAVEWREPSFYDLVDESNLYITVSKPSGSNFTEGATQVIYIAMDRNYNSVSCMFTVTINVTDDSILPTISDCPSDITSWVAMGTTEATVTWTPPTATDNFGTPAFIWTADPGSVFTLGDTVVNYTATDKTGNEALCSFTVTVAVDDQPPVITGCPGNIVEYVKEDVPSLSVTWSDLTVTDNSGSFTSTLSHTSGDVFPASITRRNDPVVLTYTDGFGNTAECRFTVSVLVDTAPVINCPGTIERDNVAGRAYADVSWPEVTVVDDYTSTSSLMITTSDSEPLRVFISSPMTVTYTVTDERDNIAVCTFTITINDVDDPVLRDCPTDIRQTLEAGTSSASVSWAEPTATDNAREAPTITATASNPELFFAGMYVVRYTATDAGGNTDMCEFTVVVAGDSGNPVFDNCPVGTLNFVADAGSASTTVTWPRITATDDVDSTVTITSNYERGQVLYIGSYTVQYRARDSSGNNGYCGFNVVVADLEKPVITSCPGDQSFFVLSTSRDVRASWTVPGATDNSGSATVTRTSGSAPGTRYGIGSETVVYRAEDASGNFAECSFVIDVAKKEGNSTIVLEGRLVLDQVQGFNGIFGSSVMVDNLRNDLDDLFRGTALSQDFVSIEPADITFDLNDDFVFRFLLYLCATSHYNEEDVKAFFYGALSGAKSDSFASDNVIVTDSFNLDVAEFRGQFVLRSIQSPGTVPVDYEACCSDPDSESYQNLLGRIYDHFDRTYGTESSFKLSKVLLLSAGSVVVDYTLTYNNGDAPDATMLEQTFNNTVASSTSELVEGTNTGLYLAMNGFTPGDIEAVCPVNYCLNGGTCSVMERSTYRVDCSCISVYYGDRCEKQGLSLEEIISIAVGSVVGLLMIILLALCCCYWALAGRSSRARYAQALYIEEMEEARKQRRMKKMRRRAEPRREPQGELLVPVETLRRSPHRQFYPSPGPPPLPLKVDRGVVNGGYVQEVISERPAFRQGPQNGQARRARPPSPIRLMEPVPAHQEARKEMRKKREKGPVFHAEQETLPHQKQKQEVKKSGKKAKGPTFHAEQETNLLNRKQMKAKKREKGPTFHAEKETKALRGREENKMKKKREKGPSFHAEQDPEPVAEPKERRFHDFNY